MNKDENKENLFLICRVMESNLALSKAEKERKKKTKYRFLSA